MFMEPRILKLSKLRALYLLEHILYIGRYKSIHKRNYLIKVNISCVEFGQIVSQYRFSALIIQSSNRNNVAKASWAQHRCIELSDIVCGSHQQNLVHLIF